MNRFALLLTVALGIALVVMTAYNLYLLWLFGDILINEGFNTPELAYYIGSIIKNAVLILLVSLSITFTSEFIQYDK